MHMADALLSPAVGTAMWAGTIVAMGYASKKMKENFDDKITPLMGVLGAFIFAAQMINFTIPGTGSSGHLGGGMILAIMLGPYAAFLVMASVLTVQAMFFADGGLLALGCNIWNLGIYPCFLVYPLIYKPLVGDSRSPRRILVSSLVSVVAALQLGAFSVVLETLLSGKSELPFGTFVLLMQPIHLAIGIVEGLVTAGVINYVHNARPEILESIPASRPLGAEISVRKIIVTFAVLAVITGGLSPGSLLPIRMASSGPSQRLRVRANWLHRSMESLHSSRASRKRRPSFLTITSDRLPRKKKRRRNPPLGRGLKQALRWPVSSVQPSSLESSCSLDWESGPSEEDIHK